MGLRSTRRATSNLTPWPSSSLRTPAVARTPAALEGLSSLPNASPLRGSTAMRLKWRCRYLPACSTTDGIAASSQRTTVLASRPPDRRLISLSTFPAQPLGSVWFRSLPMTARRSLTRLTRPFVSSSSMIWHSTAPCSTPPRWSLARRFHWLRPMSTLYRSTWCPRKAPLKTSPQTIFQMVFLHLFVSAAQTVRAA